MGNLINKVKLTTRVIKNIIKFILKNQMIRSNESTMKFHNIGSIC